MNTTVDTFKADDLPLNLNDKRSVLWWSMIGLITIESVVFLFLIVSYYYLHFHAHTALGIKLRNLERPDLVLPIISTVLIILSVIPIYWGDQGIRRGDRRRLIIGMSIGVVLASAFLVLKIIEYSDKDFNWASDAHGSIVWTIIGFHSAHVTVLLLKSVVAIVAAARGHFDENRNVGIQINGLYWYFVVVVWLPLFATIYIAPYLMLG